MDLRRAVAAPFGRRGVTTMNESEFVVALSLDRDWFSPDQAKRLIDVATAEGELVRDGDELRPAFDASAVDVPEDFTPGEDVLRQRSTFERVLDAVVDRGVEKQDAVASINRLQADLGVSIEAAAIVFARREGVDVSGIAERALAELTGSDE